MQQMTAVRDHVRQCPECQTYLSDMLDLETQIANLPLIPASTRTVGMVMKRIQCRSNAMITKNKECPNEAKWRMLLISGALFAGVPYCVNLLKGQWLLDLWAVHLQSPRNFPDPGHYWAITVIGAIGVSLVAAAILQSNIRPDHELNA